MFVYVDESGDLGFSKKGATNFFVVSYLILDSPHSLTLKMKRLLKRLHQTGKYAKGNCELKHSNSNQTIRKKVLEKICECEVKIGFIVLEKQKVYSTLREDPRRIYNYFIVHSIMSNLVPKLTSTDKLTLIIDRSLSGHKKEAFNEYARNKASWIVRIEGNDYPLEISNIEIQHLSSHGEPCLQAADFLAGTCFYKYERSNHYNFRLIEQHVTYFDYYWK